MYLNRRAGSRRRAGRPGHDRPEGEHVLRLRGEGDGLLEPGHRRERAERRLARDPVDPENAQYRANVLLFLQTLRARGAQPWLLVNSKPYTADEAGDWWRQVADVAGIMREVYFPAPRIYNMGPIRANRTLRQAFRNGILDFTKIGVPVSKLGIFLGFQTSRGSGGREGLEAKAWYRTVKWQALSAQYVGRRCGSIPSGRGAGASGSRRRATGSRQVTRRLRLPLDAQSALCNGPRVAGKGFVKSRKEGQPYLPRGLRCTLGNTAVRWSSINPILKLTGDAELAFSTTFARAVQQRVRQCHVRADPCCRALDHRRPLRRLACRLPEGDRGRPHECNCRARHHRRRAPPRPDREAPQGPVADGTADLRVP